MSFLIRHLHDVIETLGLNGLPPTESLQENDGSLQVGSHDETSLAGAGFPEYPPGYETSEIRQTSDVSRYASESAIEH
jgi:hypothetical protein